MFTRRRHTINGCCCREREHADDAEGVDGGTPKVMLGAAELLRGLGLRPEARELGALLQCL